MIRKEYRLFTGLKKRQPKHMNQELTERSDPPQGFIIPVKTARNFSFLMKLLPLVPLS